MAARRSSPPSSTPALPSPACASPSPANSPAAPSRTASSIWPKPKAWPTSSTPRPRPSAARRCGSAAARCRSVYEAWRERLIEAAALIEAEIDFPDEDLPGALARRAGPILQALAAEMAAHLDDAHRGERIRDGYRIAIIGPPNAGKSSLLNALAQREAAIVSDIPGTTRDVVEVRLVLAGFPGLDRRHRGPARGRGRDRGGRRAPRAGAGRGGDLRIGVVEAGAEIPSSLKSALGTGDVLALSKADLGPPAGPPTGAGAAGEPAVVRVSARTGAGLADLEALLARYVGDALGREEAPVLTRARHRRLVEEARAALLRAIPALDRGAELAAEDVRAATAAWASDRAHRCRRSARRDLLELLHRQIAIARKPTFYAAFHAKLVNAR